MLWHADPPPDGLHSTRPIEAEGLENEEMQEQVAGLLGRILSLSHGVDEQLLHCLESCFL